MAHRDIVARAGDHFIFVMRVVEHRPHRYRLGLAFADDRVDAVAAFLGRRAGETAPQPHARRIDVERPIGAGQRQIGQRTLLLAVR